MKPVVIQPFNLAKRKKTSREGRLTEAATIVPLLRAKPTPDEQAKLTGLIDDDLLAGLEIQNPSVQEIARFIAENKFGIRLFDYLSAASEYDRLYGLVASDRRLFVCY